MEEVSKTPLVSIITVTYNAGKFLEQTMQSVFSQTYSNIEYLIIDGNSTDETVNIIKRHENQLAYWVSEKDGGIYDAMNKGIQKSKGELIGIVNASDFYKLDAVENVVKAYLQHSEIGIFHGNMNMLNQDGSFFKEKKTSEENVRRLNTEFSIHHPTFFVTRSTYEKFGAYSLDFKITADYDFALRCYMANVKFYHIDDVISNFRIGGISSKQKMNCLKESRRALINNHVSEEEAEKLFRQWIRQERKNQLYRFVYNLMNRVLPHKILSKLALKFSVK